MIYLGSVEFLNLLRYQFGCTYVCASKIPMHIYMCPPYIYVVIHFLLFVCFRASDFPPHMGGWVKDNPIRTTLLLRGRFGG